MARLILDTSVLIGAERRAEDLERAVEDEDDVAIAAITAAELLVGVELASGKRRETRARYVEEVLATLTVEDYTFATARAHADLLAEVHRSGRPRGAHDLVIAATAVATSRTLVTSDARGFADLPRLELHLLGSG